jgi:hypothetical protein
MGVIEALDALAGGDGCAEPGDAHGQSRRGGVTQAADVDVEAPEGLDRRAVDWPRRLLAQVQGRTDEELGKDAAVIEVLRGQGWSLARIAKRLGQDIVWVRQTRREARARSLVDGAVAAARAEVEGMLDVAVDNVRKKLREGDKDVTLAVVRGTGVLSSDHAAPAGSMSLQVTFVQTVEGHGSGQDGSRAGDGPVVSVQGRQVEPLGLTGVVGAPNSAQPTVPRMAPASLDDE